VLQAARVYEDFDAALLEDLIVVPLLGVKPHAVRESLAAARLNE
jgi:hypothetical protein